MGPISDWIASSVQPLLSCLSANEVDEKTVTAKTTKRRRFWMINRSPAVAPETGEKTLKQIGKITSDPAKTKHADKPSGSQTSLDKLRSSNKGRPLPVPNKSSTKTKSKKTKEASPSTGCKNTQHDTLEIRLRLTSKFQKDKKAFETTVGGSSDGKEDLMKKIDKEVRKKVDKVFGKLSVTNAVSKGKRKVKKNRVSVINDVGNEKAEVDGNESYDDDDDIVIGKPDIAIRKASRKMDRVEVIDLDGNESHDDDDDIVFGNPDIASREISAGKENIVKESDGYETHDDDDDIVIGKPDIAPKENSAKVSKEKTVMETDGYESHDDDDDIVFGYSGTSFSRENSTENCKVTSGQSSAPEKSGFAEIIQDIADTLGEIKSRTTEQTNRDVINMFYNGRLGRGLSSFSTGAGATPQTQNPGYGLLITDLADRLGEMKSSNCDAQARRREMQSLLKTGNIMNLDQFQSLASGTSKPK